MKKHNCSNRFHTHFYIRFYIICCILSLTSCFSNKKIPGSLEAKPAEIFVNTSATYVVTYLLKVQKIGEGFEFQLTNVIKKEGFLKTPKGFQAAHTETGSFEISFWNAQGQKLHSTTFPNPLTKHFEVPNEDGNIEKKTVELTEETLAVRINEIPNITKISIDYITEASKIFIQSIEL